MSGFAPAMAIADAVLYEGYLLFPYTASARKNRMRWQFGVIVPPGYAVSGGSEGPDQQTEVLLEGGRDAEIEVLVRFLQVQTRQVERAQGGAFEPVEELVVEDRTHVTFDETVERQVVARLALADTAATVVPIAYLPGRSLEMLCDAAGTLHGRMLRERWELAGTLTVSAERISERSDLTRMRVELQNRSALLGTRRETMLRTAFVSAHTLLATSQGRFLSAVDPPLGAEAATAALVNRRTWPVLVGPHDDSQGAPLVLSAPIILSDFPAVAERSAGDAFDGTEIDELLTLSVLSLPDSERAAARATHPRAAAIVERAERFGAAEVARLHDGDLQRADPFAALDVPSLDCLFVGGTKVAKGSTVRLRPKRRADVWDSFLAGKRATVQAIHEDFENQRYVAVTVDDDPASELHEWYGRSFFFYPDEIEV